MEFHSKRKKLKQNKKLITKAKTRSKIKNLRTKDNNLSICRKKLSIHFGEDETKCILFTRNKNLPELNITYKNNRIKQYRMAEYLGCIVLTLT